MTAASPSRRDVTDWWMLSEDAMEAATSAATDDLVDPLETESGGSSDRSDGLTLSVCCATPYVKQTRQDFTKPDRIVQRGGLGPAQPEWDGVATYSSEWYRRFRDWHRSEFPDADSVTRANLDLLARFEGVCFENEGLRDALGEVIDAISPYLNEGEDDA